LSTNQQNQSNKQEALLSLAKADHTQCPKASKCNHKVSSVPLSGAKERVANTGIR